MFSLVNYEIIELNNFVLKANKKKYINFFTITNQANDLEYFNRTYHVAIGI